MKTIGIFLINVCVIFSAFLFSGCATKKVVKESTLIWPSPPEEPKIIYLSQHRGDRDYDKKASMVDMFIGKSVMRSNKNLVKPYGAESYGNKYYVADTAQATVFVFDTNSSVEKPLTFIGQNSSVRLALPVDLAIAKKGEEVYVSDAKLRKVFVFNQQGRLLRAIGKKNEFMRPSGIAVNDELQRLYVVDTKGHCVKVYSSQGEYLFTFGKRGEAEATFNFPTNIAVDRRNGNVAIVDTQNFRVQIFDQDGNFISTFGDLGDRPGMFARPKGVAIDTEGHIYVADSAFSNIQIFNDKGELLLYFGNKGARHGQFVLLSGLNIDEQDRLLVADSFNGRIQVFQYVSDQWKRNNPDKYQELLGK